MVSNQTSAILQPDIFRTYREEITAEMNSIAAYWMRYTIDEQWGGFYGSVSNDNIPDKQTPKGIVLNSRILWTFSALYLEAKLMAFKETANRAFDYILDHFIDHEFGGVFWSVDYSGKMADGKKQIYGLAFCIYGMSAYYRITNDKRALDLALHLFEYIEKYSYDNINKGYTEAFTREWKPIADRRLSPKDENEQKTMNTHLHIIEGYANLYSVWPDMKLGSRITELLEVFSKYIINKESFHLNLFMDEQWKIKSSLVSFGHDAEAAWLLQECAEISGNKTYTTLYRELAVKMADAAAEGLDSDGGIFYEYDPQNDHWIKEKHSWPQAEAMVGFFNAYELTGQKKYFHFSLDSWKFIKNAIKDKVNGEWYWGIDEHNNVMKGRDKAGFWKCPYHSIRACLEIIRRVENRQNNKTHL